METKVFCVYDSKIAAYQKPFHMRTTGEGLRAFIDACRLPDCMFSKHPGDFTLFHIANYDENSGKFENLVAPVSLGTAIEYVTPTQGSVESQKSR